MDRGRIVPGRCATKTAAWRAILRRDLGECLGLKAGFGEEAEPVVSAEEAQCVGLVRTPDRAVGIAKEERVRRHGRGVGGIRIRGPLEVADAAAVATVDAAVVGPWFERLSDVIRHEDRDAATSGVHERGLDRPPQIGLSGHVVDRVVHEDRVERAGEADGAHVALLVLAFRG